jgi:hypothetical protein
MQRHSIAKPSKEFEVSSNFQWENGDLLGIFEEMRCKSIITLNIILPRINWNFESYLFMFLPSLF